MSYIEEPKPEEVEAERVLLNACRQRWQAAGFNLDEILISWGNEEAKALESWSARADFEELCAHEWNQEILAVLIASFRYSSNLEGFWSELVGLVKWVDATLWSSLLIGVYRADFDRRYQFKQNKSPV